MVDNKTVNRVNPITIYNDLRALGFKRGLLGTTLINKITQILISTNDEYFNLTKIYNDIALSSNGRLTPSAIREYIRYAIKTCDLKKAENNFEKVFGYKYDETLFDTGNKDFITELIRLFLNKNIM